MRNSFMVAAAAVGLFFSSYSTHADVKIEEQELAPAGQWLICTTSARGVHAAALAMKGSRYTVLIDGVEGPRIEQMLSLDGNPFSAGQTMVFSNQSLPVVFSDDGSHCAYLAKAGNDYVVMLDGKELARAPWASGRLSGLQLQFAPGGKHLFWMESDTSAGSRLIVDGKPEPWLQNQPQLVTSPDGSHYAYAATRRGEQKATLFVDGKDAGYPGDDPHFTADGQHLFALVREGQSTGLMVDGKPRMKTDGISHVYMAPVGGGFAVVLQRLEPRGEFLVVNGKRIDGSDCQNIANFYFSPDAKRFAAICRTASGAQYVIVDGKKGDEYPNISTGMSGAVPGGVSLDAYSWKNGHTQGDPAFQNLQPTAPGFTPDSSKFVYVASVPPRYFLVVDGEESNAYTGSIDPVFGGGGKRIGFIVNSMTGGKPQVVIDGKASEQKTPQALSFTPDGSHYTFISGIGNGVSLYVDGAEVPGITVTPHYLFSPDAKHLVVMGFSSADGSRRGMFIDGKLVVTDAATLNRVDLPKFTPDSQHLMWLSRRQPSGPDDHDDSVLFVDGKPSVHFVNFSPQVTGNWDMSNDGVLTFIARTGDAIKRFRVTPPGDTSIETMLANPVK